MIGFLPFVQGAPAPGTRNVWSQWVERILKQKEFGFTKAAMVYQDHGVVAAANKQFLSQHDVQEILQIFQDIEGHHGSADSLHVNSHTYIMKTAEPSVIVAFNGGKHLIALRSARMCIVAVCSARKKIDQATKWLDLLRQSLIQRKY